MKSIYFILPALCILFFLGSCQKKDPARPAKHDFIETGITEMSVLMYPGREIWEEISMRITDTTSGIDYEVSLYALSPEHSEYANCTINLSGFNLFTPASRIIEPVTPSGDDIYIKVAPVNDSISLSIEVTAPMSKRVSYVETKKLLLHFTPDTKVYFQEFSASDITPYLQPGGISQAKAFYEELLQRTGRNNGLVEMAIYKR